MKWHTEIRKISELKEWEDNPRIISESRYERLKESIKKRGFHDIIKIDENNVVLSGNQRLKALKELGYEEIECKVCDEILNQDQKDAVAVESNMQDGEWDMDKLAEGFSDVMEEIGYGDLMPEVVPEVEEDDYEEPEDLETTVVLGDVYQLGEHRLVCGDSTKIEDVEKLMDGEKADMVFTDPPYGMFLNADFSEMVNNLDFAKDKGFKGGRKYKNVVGDSEDFNPDFINTIFSVFGYCKEIMLWGANYYSELLQDRNQGSWFVWDKRLDESADKMYGSCFELLWSKNKHKQDIARVKWASVFGTEKEFDHKRHHPTQKPIELSCWFITKYSEEGKNVVDLFGGSGSTLIACEQTNRKCYMLELDPHNCQVIIDRWEKYTNKEAKKL
jgi:DNA modification methylase